MNSNIMTVVLLILCFVVMYFLMIRPQRKQEEEMKALRTSLKVGDSVKTSSGFYGTILGIEGEVVIVEFGNDRHCRIPMDISYIVEADRGDDDSEE